MSEFTSEDIAGREGKENLADAIKNSINDMLMKVEGFGGIENVHFTSFVIQ
jgi:flagellar FliL protein